MCAARRVVVNLLQRGGNSEERFLGHPAYLASKDKGDSSMLEKRRTVESVVG
jgi:hypothetical protein